MIIVDGHQDIGYNYQEKGRDFRLPALKKRQHEDTDTVKDYGQVSLGLPDALLGRVGVIFATLFVSPSTSRWPSVYSYSTPREAHDLVMQQLDYYRRLADEDERLQLILNRADLDAVLATWAKGTDISDHRVGLVLLMEGADPIIEPPQVVDWYERGVRIVGPAWTATRYAGGTGRPGPLTALGHELLAQMANLGMILDLSHLAEEAYYQALDRYEGPVLASHSNPRHFVDSDRMLSDEMIRRLAEHDSVMGIVLYNRFLKADWKRNDPKSDVTLDHVIDVIDHICQLTGSARHVGIGSDMDGGFGSESIPAPLDTVADLWLFDEALRKRRFTAGDVEAILGGNMLRILVQGLPT